MTRKLKRRLYGMLFLFAATGILFMSGCAAKKGCGCGNNVNLYTPKKFKK